MQDNFARQQKSDIFSIIINSAIISGIIIVLVTVLSFFPAKREPFLKVTKTCEPVRAENVGHAIGDKTTRFGKGLVKGVWHGLFPKKEKKND